MGLPPQPLFCWRSAAGDVPSETGAVAGAVVLFTTMFGCTDSDGGMWDSIDATLGAATPVCVTDCAVAARGDFWGVVESEVNATTPRTAADIAPAVSVVATLWALSVEPAAVMTKCPTRVAGRRAEVAATRIKADSQTPVRPMYASRSPRAIHSRRRTVATETPSMAAISRLVRPSR